MVKAEPAEQPFAGGEIVWTAIKTRSQRRLIIAVDRAGPAKEELKLP